MVLANSIMTDLFQMGVPILDKVLRTIAVYLALLVLLRLAGKRDLAQLNSFDLVVLLLLSNVVQNAVIGPDNSLWGGLLGAAILIAANAVMVRASVRFGWLDHVVEGNATQLVSDGKLIKGNLRRLGLRHNEVYNAVRHQGANSIADVMDATLGPGGAIQVTLRANSETATKGDIARLEEKLDRMLRGDGSTGGGAEAT